MARQDKELRITQSVLDRLIDYEPKNSNEALKSRSKSLSDLKQFVKRDLEWLLNSRSYAGDIDADLEEIKKSIITYGLPDITGMSVKSQIELNKLSEALEETIKNFEPRFLNLKISLEPVEHTDKELKFKIEAFLDVEPAPEPVVFDTILELSSGDFEVRQGY